MSGYLYGALAGAVLILAGLLWWQGGRLDRARTEFAAYKAAQVQAVADAASAAQAKAQETEKHNADVMAQITSKLDGSIADGTRLAVRLRLALANRDSGTVPESSGQPDAAIVSGRAGGNSQSEKAIAAVFAACERDGTRLDALIEQIKPQLEN